VISVAAVVCCVEAETWSVEPRALGDLGTVSMSLRTRSLPSATSSMPAAMGPRARPSVDGDVDALERRACGLDRGDALLADLVAGGDGLDGAPRLGLDLLRRRAAAAVARPDSSASCALVGDDGEAAPVLAGAAPRWRR
jgi:hypothetical protein